MGLHNSSISRNLRNDPSYAFKVSGLSPTQKMFDQNLCRLEYEMLDRDEYSTSLSLLIYGKA